LVPEIETWEGNTVETLCSQTGLRRRRRRRRRKRRRRRRRRRRKILSQS
jgi:hypothetical protein